MEGVRSPARRKEGREGQWVETHRSKQKVITYRYAHAIMKLTCVLTLKFNTQGREVNALSPGLDCPLYFL